MTKEINNKYHTDPSGHCEVLCRKKVIARAYIGHEGYSVRILQGMDRMETIEKIREDCPEFLTANKIPEKYYPMLFSESRKKRKIKLNIMINIISQFSLYV